jgi:hypothetical protein
MGFSHAHEPIRVQHETVKDAPVTHVLWRCWRCGDVYSEELDGTWSLEDVKGITREAADG